MAEQQSTLSVYPQNTISTVGGESMPSMFDTARSVRSLGFPVARDLERLDDESDTAEHRVLSIAGGFATVPMYGDAAAEFAKDMKQACDEGDRDFALRMLVAKCVWAWVEGQRRCLRGRHSVEAFRSVVKRGRVAFVRNKRSVMGDPVAPFPGHEALQESYDARGCFRRVSAGSRVTNRPAWRLGPASSVDDPTLYVADRGVTMQLRFGGKPYPPEAGSDPDLSQRAGPFGMSAVPFTAMRLARLNRVIFMYSALTRRCLPRETAGLPTTRRWSD